MSRSQFRPGFRISIRDTAVLGVGILSVVLLRVQMPVGAFVIGFVILHFFLFCNVFRIPRRPELIWAGTFVLLSCSTISVHVPGWIFTVVASLALSIFLICHSMAGPDYHGVGWQRINPGLREWWEEHVDGA